MVEVDRKDEAEISCRPAIAHDATIVQLNKFGLEELDDLIKRHEGR